MKLDIDTSPIIKVIDEDYNIPSLKRQRRVAALLPHDYGTSAAYYPVLYLHDGQNLFGNRAPFGNWGVTQTLAELAKMDLKVVVISIDHGGKDRINEYMPYDNPKYTYKQGQLYLDWMMSDLKPYVDEHFRVKPEREFTGVGGSSMGALISLFAGFQYNQNFGKMMIFSPSLWISNQVFYHAQSFKIKGQTDIYMYAGGDESKEMKGQMDQLEQILQQRTNNENINLKHTYLEEGKHQEYFWGLEFPHALSWLYRGQKK
jgi:predicted alpha/beta superfamily hydrolase